jgi:hypothetical protein
VLNPAALAKLLSLQYWLGLPRERMRIVRRFVAIAITLAAAKVFLNTVGFALFLANEGPAQLPRFYVVLALVAITLSAVLGVVVDRLPKLGVARATLVAILVLAGTGKWMIDADVAGSYFIILSSAFIFEIAIEILFWAACAAYLDTMELKRATPLICLAIALGGAFGGLLARTLAWTIDSPDLLLTMLVFACLATLQFALPADIQELPDGQTVTARRQILHLAGLSRVCSRYPLLILAGLNALTLTILYGIAEFLIFSVYSENYPEEQELTRFLGSVFALLQTCEFLLLASLSRVLLERTSPLLRNLVFPLASLVCLVCLVYLAFSNKLSAAVVTHINAEAASNAIFQPVHNQFPGAPPRDPRPGADPRRGRLLSSRTCDRGGDPDVDGQVRSGCHSGVYRNPVRARLHPAQRRRRPPLPAHAHRERAFGCRTAGRHRQPHRRPFGGCHRPGARVPAQPPARAATRRHRPQSLARP